MLGNGTSNRVLAVAAAVLALAAVFAHGAHAAKWVASAYPTNFTGSSTRGSEYFTTEAGKVECDNSYSGTMSKADPWVEATYTYTNCEAFSGLSAKIPGVGCRFRLKLVLSTTAEVDINCPPGVVQKMEAGTCKWEFGVKNTYELISVGTNEGKVILQPSVEGIDYVVTQDGFGCPFKGTGEKTDGGWFGAVTFEAGGGASLGVE
jgi:hypothetical protein